MSMRTLSPALVTNFLLAIDLTSISAAQENKSMSLVAHPQLQSVDRSDVSMLCR